MQWLTRFDRLATMLTDKLAWGPALLARLTMAAVFVHSGLWKFEHRQQVAGFFESLHLPAPAAQAVFVASNEIACGVLLLVGLFARLASLPLSIIMLVALATAKRGDIHSIADLANTAEFVNLVVLVWLMVGGPGAVSIDHRLRTLANDRRSSASPVLDEEARRA